MANISDATGMFTFDENFYTAHAQAIDEYFAKADLMGEYGIEVNVDGNSSSFNFVGAGRWSMADILEWCLTPADFDIATADCTQLSKEERHVADLFHQWYDDFAKSGAEVDFNYTDYEPGSMFYVEQDAIVMANTDETEQALFTADISDMDDLGFSDRIRIENDLEEGFLVDDSDDCEQLYQTVAENYAELPTRLTNRYLSEEIAQAIINLARSNADYDGGIILWRLDDALSLADMADEALDAEVQA